MAKSKTNLVVIQPEISNVVNSSQIDKSVTMTVAQGYAPLMTEIQQLSESLADMDKENPTEEDIKSARKNRLLLVKVRGRAEDKKKEDKAEILSKGKLIDGLYNVVVATSELTEQEYSKIEKFEQIRQKAEEDRLFKERSELLEEYGTDISYIPLGQITAEQFDQLLEREKIAAAARKKAEAEAIEQKIIDDRLEEERLAKLAEENERLRIENERRVTFGARCRALTEVGLNFDGVNFFAGESELIAEGETLFDLSIPDFAKLVARGKKRVGELRAEADRIAAIENAEKERKDRELAELHAEIQAGKDEVIRLGKEKEEKERLASLAPDKEKVNAVYKQIKAITLPDFSTAGGKKFAQVINTEIINLLQKIKTEAQNIK